MKTENLSYENQLQDMRDRNNAFEQQNAKHPNVLLKFDRENVVQGFIYSELLGKPKAKRKRRW